MKKLTTIYILLAVATFTACKKTLDEQSYSAVTQENYQYTDKDYYPLIGKVYANLRSMWGEQDYYMAQEATTDEIVMPANASGWDDGGIYKRMHLHIWNADQSQITNTWSKPFAGILNANLIIELLSTGKVPVPADVNKNAALAEMRVARAFYYWLICDNFGDAPLDTTTSKELPSKVTRKEVYNFIVAEINNALPLLSEEKGTLYYGRFNKWAAKALLANVYLNAKVYTGEEHWNDCLTQCNDIINGGGYSLAPNFRDNFVTDNSGSPEIIFAIPFDEILGTNFYVYMYSWHAALRAKYDLQTTPYGAGSSKGIPQFINTYDTADGRLADTWLMGPQFAADGVTPLLGSYDLSGKPLVFANSMPDGLYTGEADGYRMNKFEVKMGAKRDLSNDFPFFRYAQVLLMKAECLLRTGNSGEAAALVTQVRTRNFKTELSRAAVTPADLLRDSRYSWGYVEHYQVTDKGNVTPVEFGGLYDELGWEFAWEGYRRRDMIRFGTFTGKSWLSHKPNGDYRSVFPIPQPVIDANPKMVQNPNYQ
ncbi:RagB/SusD family nutrient uptake outer membrane protein [Deminuibacter soli]|uniref:RagB/SusD family nutrient uptake outer membrane protein n=1 Tax=Deminuibacter soli TaxID=2291815 RepID=A0A3E1NIP9_9BACT|nr:RagB/SusD family nutrient uptake outer membrane protein [Deminuibacter soli]RFM27826.1 RagB/SusD family nutrient uptake outer membrane protein [Deminuibacter soli]